MSVSPANYFAGFQDIKVSATGNDLDATSFAAYCIDPLYFSSTAYQDNYTPSLTHSVAAVFAMRVTDIQKLFDRYYAGTVGNNANAAAFQLALSEIANDDGVLTTGAVQTNGTTFGALVTNAQSLLGNFASYAGPQIYSLTLYQVNRSIARVNGQDYIVAMPVPEPSTYALLLAGLGLVGLGSRHSRRLHNPPLNTTPRRDGYRRLAPGPVSSFT